jgi:hypothetical protein
VAPDQFPADAPPMNDPPMTFSFVPEPLWLDDTQRYIVRIGHDGDFS